MNLDKLNLLLQGVEAYQDIEIKGSLIVDGYRDCVGRWKLIKPHIKPNSVVFDIGSDFGYFAQKVVEEIPNTIAVSVESAEKKSEIQKEVLRLKQLKNVILAKYNFDLGTLNGLAATVTAIDTFVVLSVFHHYSLENTKKQLEVMAKLAPQLIIEVPQVHGAVNVTGPEYTDFDKVLRQYYEKVELILDAPFGAGQNRRIYRATNSHFEREGLVPAYTYDTNPNAPNRTHYLGYKNGGWIHKKKSSAAGSFDMSVDWISGISAHTMLWLNPVYPAPEWWQDNAVAAYEKLIEKNRQVGDIRPQNLIITAKGWVAIDWQHEATPEFQKRDLKSTGKIFAEMSLKNIINYFKPEG